MRPRSIVAFSVTLILTAPVLAQPSAKAQGQANSESRAQPGPSSRRPAT